MWFQLVVILNAIVYIESYEAQVTDTLTITTPDRRSKDIIKPIDGTIYFRDRQNESIPIQFLDWTPTDKTDSFEVTNPVFLKEIENMRITNDGLTDWRVELISLEHGFPDPQLFQFPIDRTLASKSTHNFGIYDAFLPQKDPNPQQRSAEIGRNRNKYEYGIVYRKDNIKVILVKNVPPEEQFSITYMKKLQKNLGDSKDLEDLKAQQSDANWTSYDEMLKLYADLKLKVLPMYANKEFLTDVWFGLQRLQGINPGVLQRVIRIPKEKLGITVKQVKELKERLEGHTLETATAANKLFMVDFEILKNVRKDLSVEIPAPIALFYLHSNGSLMPIAIQLLQNKAPDNPVFTPLNDKHTWLMAKMFFHLADSSHHQGITHLGHIHYVPERIIIALYRNVSPSHPIFRLLKPHTLFTIAINRVALNSMASNDNSAKTVGVTGKGILYLTEIAGNSYNMNKDGNVHNLFEHLGTTEKYLKYYPYRDDITATYDIVHRYVKKIVTLYYKNSSSSLLNDQEIQAWRKELSHSAENLDGAGLKGIPGSDTEGFQTLNQLIDVVTIIIHTASCRHAAINFLQYDYYGFQPNSPSYFEGPLPTTTDPVSEQFILNKFARRKQMIDIINFAKGLSDKQTNMLGNFEVPALYHPEAIEAIKEFVKEINDFSRHLKEINKTRQKTYPWGDPKEAPNAVSV